MEPPRERTDERLTHGTSRRPMSDG